MMVAKQIPTTFELQLIENSTWIDGKQGFSEATGGVLSAQTCKDVDGQLNWYVVLKDEPLFTFIIPCIYVQVKDVWYLQDLAD